MEARSTLLLSLTISHDAALCTSFGTSQKLLRSSKSLKQLQLLIVVRKIIAMLRSDNDG